MTVKNDETSDKEDRGRARNRARRSASSESDSSSSSSSSSSSGGSSSSDDSSSDSSRGDFNRQTKRPPNAGEKRRSPVNRKKLAESSSGRQRSRSPHRPSRRSPSPKPSKLVVNGLTKNVTKDHVMEIFSHYGDIKSVDFPNERHTPQRIVAYVEYGDHAEAEKAQKFMDGGQVDGQVIGIRTVLPMRRRPPPRRMSPPMGGHRGGWHQPAPWRRSPPRRRRSPPRRLRSPPKRRSPPRRRRERSKSSSSESR